MSTGQVVDAEAVEEPLDGGDEEAGGQSVRALPERRSPSVLMAGRSVFRALAVVAAGGLAPGAATVAAVSAARAMTSNRSRRPLRRSRGDRDVIASRSFLVDVHLLGR
jgi:hypothetical protein